MPTNDEGNPEATEGDGDKTPEETNDDELLSSIEDEELRKKVSDKITQERSQKKHWRKKAESKPEEPEKDDSDDNDEQGDNPDVKNLAERMNQIEENQDLARKGYSNDEIAEARAYANGKGMSVKEAIESDFVQTAISSMREKKESQDNTPRPSNRVHISEDKTVDEVLKDEKASKSEKNAALQELVKQRSNQGGASKDYS